MPDPTAPWVGAVKPPAPQRGIDLPAVDAPMELMSIAEAMDEAVSAISAASAAPQAPEVPLPPAAEVPPGPTPTPREQPAPAPIPGAAGPTVPLALVADDDPEVRQLLAKILEGLGCAVVVAADGKEALRMVRELRPRLVVLDAMMPEVHGFEVCSAIKSDRDLRLTPVVLCSAVYRGSAGADARIAFGADAYLQKPFRLETVTQLFRHWLASGAAGAEDRERREAAERHWRAGAEELASGRLDEALGLCWRAVDEDQFSPQAHYCLGHALSQQGFLYEAVAAFERAAELEPAAEASHQCLALLYERLGFQRSAREAWAHAIEASRDPARKKVMQARLAGLLFL
jgi:CheY-like chemotaxis protein